MGRTRLAKASIKELRKNIEFAKERKKYFEEYLHELWNSFQKGLISRDFYVETAHKHFQGKTLKQWIDYYDYYINECEKLIKKHQKDRIKGHLITFIFSFVLIFILFGLSFYIRPELTGFLIQEIPEVVTEADATITTTQQQAILGQPVKWTKTISLDKPATTKIRLPIEAENIFINKISESYSEEQEEALPKEDSSPSQEEPSSSETGFSITGAVIGAGAQEGFLSKFFRNLGRITGRAVGTGAELQEIEINDTATEYEIEYETPAPYAIEEEIERGKRVKIIGPETIHYENVLSFTDLPESLNIKNPSNVKIHWVEDNSYIPIENIADLDNDGIYDYVEWITPSLSNQTFDIIVIIKAVHLDSDRNFISDIYEEVKELDDVWSEEIPEDDYVRVTFEIPLDSLRDITLYPRTISGNPKIEVYEVNQTELIAEFTTINDNQYNKVYLTNLVGEQDTFDLRVVTGTIIFDHIIDPDTGRVSPSSVSDGSNACDGMNDVLADDTGYGYCDKGKDHYVLYDSFGLVAAGCDSVDGILIECKDCYVESGKAQDFEVRASCDAGSSWSNWMEFTPNLQEESDTLVSYGGSSEMWGLSCACSDFDTNDRFRIHVIQQDTAGDEGKAYMDWLPATIYYSEAAADVESPKWQNPSVNDSTPNPGTTVRHNINWTDNTALNYATLEVNSSGTCDTAANVTNTTLSGSSQWANLSWQVPNACEGKTIGWKQYANDTGSPSNWNVTDLQTYTVQNVAPTITLPVYTNATKYKNTQSMIFNVSVIDTGIGASYCAINVAGNSNQTVAVSGGWCNGSYALTGIGDGNKTINAYANDTLGNTALNNSYVVWVDSTDPTITHDSPANSTYFNYAPYFNGTCSDSGVGLDSIYTNLTEYPTVDTSSPYNFTNTSSLTEGIYSVRINCNDSVNNTATSDFYFTFDVTSPTSTINQPSNDSTTSDNTPDIRITLTDNLGDSISYTFYLNDIANKTGVVSDNTATNITMDILPDGLWLIKVKATDNASNEVNSSTLYLTMSTNQAPTIAWVETISATNPTDDTTTSITFNFTATDTNGIDDIDNSTAESYFQNTGETTRSNASCIPRNASGNSITFTCTIDMWYFDKADTDWMINVSIQDDSAEYVGNSSTVFQYNTLTAMKMSPPTLNWSEINLPDTDTGSSNDPILINNTGNDEPMNINVTALNLRGEEQTSYYIYAANFTVDNVTDGCSGTYMVNATSVNITNATLQRGNHSLNYNNATSGQEQLFFCLKGVLSETPAQSYSSSAYGAWEIRILLVAVIPATRRRKKKKKKKEREKKKLKKSNKVLRLLIKLTEELRKDYSEEKEILISKLFKAIQEEYKVSRENVLSLIRKEVEIPINAFSKELGALEAIAKYMKENLNMNYHEIAKELGRNERTIWIAYKKATEKQKEPIKPKETKMFLPISIFKDKKLTTLESIILYLKEKRLKFSEIAKLLERDQRNIWTIYSRAIKKLNT